jgi:hypothetical protein
MKIWFEKFDNDVTELYVGKLNVGEIRLEADDIIIKGSYWNITIRLGSIHREIKFISSLKTAKELAISEVEKLIEVMSFDDIKIGEQIDFCDIKNVDNTIDFSVQEEIDAAKFIVYLMANLGVSFDDSPNKIAVYDKHMLYPMIRDTISKLAKNSSQEYVYFFNGFFSEKIMPQYGDVLEFSFFYDGDLSFSLKTSYYSTDQWKKILDIYNNEIDADDKKKMLTW